MEPLWAHAVQWRRSTDTSLSTGLTLALHLILKFVGESVAGRVFIQNNVQSNQQQKTLRETLWEGTTKSWLAPIVWTKKSRKAASIIFLIKLMIPLPHTHTHWKWHIYHPGDLNTPGLQGSSSIWKGQIWLQIYPCNLSTALHLLAVFSIKVDAVLLNLWWHRNVRRHRAARYIQAAQWSQSSVGDHSHKIIWNVWFLFDFKEQRKSCNFV